MEFVVKLEDTGSVPCQYCPFRDGENEEATKYQNLGCLPSSHEMAALFDNSGVAMSCHDNDKIACRGLASVRQVAGRTVKAYSDWYRNGQMTAEHKVSAIGMWFILTFIIATSVSAILWCERNGVIVHTPYGAEFWFTESCRVWVNDNVCFWRR